MSLEDESAREDQGTTFLDELIHPVRLRTPLPVAPRWKNLEAASVKQTVHSWMQRRRCSHHIHQGLTRLDYRPSHAALQGRTRCKQQTICTS
jgi:hypothetical protein